MLNIALKLLMQLTTGLSFRGDLCTLDTVEDGNAMMFLETSVKEI